MSPVSAGLLKLLAPSGAPATPAGLSPRQLETADFASLLQSAQRGGLASGRPVTIAKGCPAQLTADQLERVAVAADKAEAQGATRALVMLDGAAFKLDVTTRQITAVADMAQPGVTTGIDAVITMPSPNASAVPGALPAPGVPPSNPSLLQLLARSRSAN